MKKIFTLFALVLMAGAVNAQTTWNLDQGHSSVGFAVSHMVVSEATGSFKDYTVKVVSNTADFDGADVEFSAKVASINTDNANLISAKKENSKKYLKSKLRRWSVNQIKTT